MARTCTDVIERLADKHTLSAQEYRILLLDDDADDCAFLQEMARRVSVGVFGNGVFVRGLIEVSNHCRNNCLYCGIRAANTELNRYRLSREDIISCCARGYELGFRTFVLQGGEDAAQTDEWVCDVVGTIRDSYPDCAITLSLGEKSEASYRSFKAAGADRYLLRHETFDPDHYALLHPAGMSRERRLGCLRALKEAGFQTGTGFMVGSPYQTVDTLVEDIMFIQDLRPEMIGIGPFVHHNSTPFAAMPDGSVALTHKLISIFRLMDPCALIPATTSLATLDPSARGKAVLAGANVVMPNLTPAGNRQSYDLYEGKASSGAESAEGLGELEKELGAIGYEINFGRGDYDKRTYLKQA